MTEIKHIVFNPSYIELQKICETYETAGWQLVRILPYSQYATVAVFQRESTHGN